MSISQWLIASQAQLQAVGITTARLDVCVMLSDALNHDKAWLIAHDDQSLTTEQLQSLQRSLQRRVAREPLAYIRGKQEFYGREFSVTSDTLIPRPETEGLIEAYLQLNPRQRSTVLDVGTGSGAIAITLACERPDVHVFATDISTDALALAKKNADQLQAHVTFAQRDLLQDLLAAPAVIIANLPYVDPVWQRSIETDFEPPTALFAADHGLALLKKLIVQAAQLQTPGNYLLLELDPRQQTSIVDFAGKYRYQAKAHTPFTLILRKHQP